jgi:CRISPR-associated protein Csb2
MVEITFREALAGPLALGFGCHYGLGMFAPVTGS